MNRSKRLLVNKIELLYASVILAFVPAPYLHRILPSIATVESLVKLAALVYVLINLVTSKGRILKSKILLLIVMFWGYLLFPTILLSGDLPEYLRITWTALTLPLFMGCAVYKKQIHMINACCVVFGAYIIINTIATVLFPEGLYETVAMSGISRAEASYFLGHKNNVLSYMMPGILCLCYKNYYKNNKLNFLTWLYIIGVCGCCVIGESISSMIAIAIVIISVLIAQNERFSKYINVKTALLINFLFFVLVVVLRVQDIFSYFLVSLTGKGLDMNGRTFIWDKGLFAILQHPIMGYGIESISNILAKYLLNNESFHNVVVDLLYQGGIIGTFLFVMLLVVTNRTIDRCENVKIKNLCNAVFFASSINWMTQPVTKQRMLLIYIPILLSVYICESTVENSEIIEKEDKA